MAFRFQALQVVYGRMDKIEKREMKMKKYSLILLLMLTACYNPRLNIATMPKAPVDGPPEYIAGWKAGCETGMATYGNSYLRTKYSANVDGYRMENQNYNKGWELGQRYCSYYSATYLANKEMAYVSGDDYTKSDLRAENTWFSMQSDGWFSYEWQN